ncbi:MFS transporter [Candidatus Pantoea floridensis]|uniref:Predicted arabinose efflux permease, MFS family n=1 Tax=Candidatus Pantoea floridensis TaxID=1938870 RepID=A0A286BSK9_9GAMM|nr:MFS transporter [Pantoea floridensis]PIF23635.1 putative MFS family arabinose efflux permease [Enterobacteriaceae bacterium JKS000233]SOD37088.1 Predicted arabinose efflux permease, MFS family [Pantoea floridensis]HBZ14367.1 MFS transporter [Pantoea sp.]
MSLETEIVESPLEVTKPEWGAVFAMAFGVFGLITAEFLPVSLLTPIADTLHISEGQAGQTVTVTALVALLTSLVIGNVTRQIDRRLVMLGFTLLLIASALLVAFAENLPMILLARVLLGVAIGGFWTLSTAITMRLVPSDQVPRALSIVFSGISLATIIAAPLGSYLGAIIGWRNIFMLTAALGVLALLWQFFTLPAMPPVNKARSGGVLDLLRKSVMRWGMLAVIMMFTGHFAFFTYLRPFLEGSAQLNVNQLSLVLLAFGVANFFGTSLAGYLVTRSVSLTLTGMALVMSVTALVLVSFGNVSWLVGAGVALWGLAFGSMPTGWSTWLSRAVPDDAESGGGLLVATIQLAITAGAAAGGWMFDLQGAGGVFLASGVLMLLAAITIFTRVRHHG